METLETHRVAYESHSHIRRVAVLISAFCRDMLQRAEVHDASKLEQPEKAGFEACAVKLRDIAYGTPEYHAAIKELGPTLSHHYAHNRHHPEHWPDGVDNMTLMDVVEMLMDWKAATERMKNGGNIFTSIDINTKRFNLSPQLRQLMINTANEFGWTAPLPPDAVAPAASKTGPQ